LSKGKIPARITFNVETAGRQTPCKGRSINHEISAQMFEETIFYICSRQDKDQSLQLAILAAIMIFNKEKVKLTNLSASIADVHLFNEENLLIVHNSFIEYAKIIRNLYKLNPNVFANLYKYDLAEIRNHKKIIKEDFSDENQKKNFLNYKNSILHAVSSAREYIVDYTES
jgi:hypothetical protein